MDPYIGEIRLFAGTFAPVGWLLCCGQQLSGQQYQALYAVIGVKYGGNASQYLFNLPDLRDSAIMGFGAGPGLTPYSQVNTKVGASTVTLAQNQLPTHTHTVNCTTANATQQDPTGGYWAKCNAPMYSTAAPDTPMNSLALQAAGAGQPHNNVQPYLRMVYMICYDGVYPYRP
jgi:microcystin-dependent protein